MPALVASAQIVSPVATPSAVNTPPARPPSSVLRTVTAVSGPGVARMTKETPTNARNDVIGRSSLPFARKRTNFRSEAGATKHRLATRCWQERVLDVFHARRQQGH